MGSELSLGSAVARPQPSQVASYQYQSPSIVVGCLTWWFRGCYACDAASRNLA